MALSLRSRLWVPSPHHEMGSKMIGSSDVLAFKNELIGSQVFIREQRSPRSSHSHLHIHAQASLCVPKAMRWWEKTSRLNMIEITSALHLVDSLLHAGDKLAVVDFYSPACGGCKALHPKICQFAEQYPDATFLTVNHEEHRSMCESLHIHVLPFFRFYRGARGRVSSFSCTNATIKKFKDALAKHGAESSCGLGVAAKGLEEAELMSLASHIDTNFSYSLRSPVPAELSSFFAEVEGTTDLAMSGLH